MALAPKRCRDCAEPLTTDNARTYQGPLDRSPRWVGRCRRCEARAAVDRYRARKVAS